MGEKGEKPVGDILRIDSLGVNVVLRPGKGERGRGRGRGRRYGVRKGRSGKGGV